MTTLRLNVNDKVLSKVLSVLNQFSADEVELISESDAFELMKAEAERDLASAEKERTYTIAEAEHILEDVIATYERRDN